MKGEKRFVFVGQDSDDFLCCLVKVGGVGYSGEVKVFQEELDRVRVPSRCC